MKPIPFRPLFSAALETADPRAARLVSSWKSTFPEMPVSAEPDFEDWVENATRRDAALRLTPQRVALVDREGTARFLDGTQVPVAEEVLFLGAWSDNDNEHRHSGVVNYPGLKAGASRIVAAACAGLLRHRAYVRSAARDAGSVACRP